MIELIVSRDCEEFWSLHLDHLAGMDIQPVGSHIHRELKGSAFEASTDGWAYSLLHEVGLEMP